MKPQISPELEKIFKEYSEIDMMAWVDRQGSIPHMIKRADEMRAERERREQATPQRDKNFLKSQKAIDPDPEFTQPS